MAHSQKCPHCKVETPKNFDKLLQKYETRRQCPNCGAQYDRADPVRGGLRISYCPWCNRHFSKTELDRIKTGDLKICPGCKTELKNVKTVRVQDPHQAKNIEAS